MKMVKVQRVATDDLERALMAFEHFRHRQFEHFACYAPAIGRYPMERVKAFRIVVEEAGFHCDVFSESVASQGWGIDHDHVVSWLSKLARPLAMFAADPYPARQLAEIREASEIAGSAIPTVGVTINRYSITSVIHSQSQRDSSRPTRFPNC